jgi:hypothetical protein
MGSSSGVGCGSVIAGFGTATPAACASFFWASQVRIVGSQQVEYHRAYSLYVCILCIDVYMQGRVTKGDMEPKLRRGDGMEGNH